jgi:hypothetical protein
MPEPLLPIRCPKCIHDQMRLYVSSASVLTVKCPECAFTWTVEIASLPVETRNQLTQVIQHQMIRH